MYLLDTNVWLERLLNQVGSDEVGKFLNQISSDQLLISDFSFHSICVILARLKRTAALIDFVQDVFVAGAVGLVSIRPGDPTKVLGLMKNFNLDFDDAYQYLAAEQAKDRKSTRLNSSHVAI